MDHDWIPQSSVARRFFQEKTPLFCDFVRGSDERRAELKRGYLEIRG
jgi:hypothetical protein